MIFSQIASLRILILSLICMAQPALAQDEKDIQEASSRKIVFLGDSITAGLGLEKSETYPHFIAQLAKESPEVTQKNLETIIKTIQDTQPKAHILLAGIEVPDNMGNAYKEKFLATFKEVAKTTEVSFYPSLIKGISGDPKFNQNDMIHPNKAGQKVIATNLFKIILPLLK